MKAIDKELIQWFNYGFEDAKYGKLRENKSTELLVAYFEGAKYYKEFPGPKSFLKDEAIINLCKKQQE